MEQESIARLNLLHPHPQVRQKAIIAYKQAVSATPIGVHPYITETWRSFERQAELYAQGRTTPGDIVTFSKAGQSYHNYGLALDFVLQVDGVISWTIDKNWMIVVKCFKANGFTWGGDFVPEKKKDPPHFENKLGHDWKDLIAKYDLKMFIPGTQFIDL